mgnify:CR=1 FL=1
MCAQMLTKLLTSVDVIKPAGCLSLKEITEVTSCKTGKKDSRDFTKVLRGMATFPYLLKRNWQFQTNSARLTLFESPSV